MVPGEAGLLNSNWFDVHLVRQGNVVIFQKIAGIVFLHFGEFIGDEVEDVGCRFILDVSLLEIAESGKDGLSSEDGDAVDDGVGVEKDRIVEGCHTFDVRF